MHTFQVYHTRQNEANFLGMSAEPDRHNLTSRGPLIYEAQQRTGSPHSNSATFRSSESPMHFNFLAGQQQMSSQQPGVMQSFPRQPFSVGDTQVLSQLQRQKQFQQLDAMQRNISSQISNFPNPMVSQHSPAINSNPVYDTSNHPWASQVMTGNTNWSQRGLSSPMQGYSNEVVTTPEQGESVRLMGSTFQGSQSLYGVPVSGSHNVNAFSVRSINKPAVPQGSSPSHPFSSNIQYAPLSEQVSVHNGIALSRPRSEGKSSFEHGSSEGFTNMVSFSSCNEMQQKNAVISESGRQDFAGGLELLREQSVSQSTTKQCAVALDPTEEKILFGSDENIWEVFGNTVDTGGANQVDISDLSNGFPVLQGGSWSALMQSAAAETSSTDIGMQEELSSLGHQNTKFQSGNQPSSVSQDYVREQPVWIDMSQTDSLGCTNATNDVNNNYVSSSELQPPSSSQPRQNFPTESLRTQEGRNWLDGSESIQHTERNWPVKNANFSLDLPNKSDISFWSNEQSSGRPSALNFIESVPADGNMTSVDEDNLHDKEHSRHRPMYTSHGDTRRPESISNFNVGTANPSVSSADNAVPSANKINQVLERKFPDNRHVDFWKSVHYGSPVMESSLAIPNVEAAEVHMTESGGAEENSNDSHQSSFLHGGPAGGLNRSVWTDADQQSNSGRKENNPFEHAAERMSLTRKFQYHPIGDLDMDVDSYSYTSKEILQPQSMPRHPSSGERNHEVHAKFHGQSSTNSSDLEVPVFFHGALKTSDVSPNNPANSTHFTKSGELSSQHQNLSSSQNILELFQKVNQSTEQASSLSHLSPRTSPPWFQQYETSKNGQLLSVHNAPRVPMAKNANQQFVKANLGPIANDLASTFAPSEQVSSLDGLASHVSYPTLASIRPKKRKTATSDLLSWSKEIGQGFMSLQNMSLAEVNWARLSHRLVEKVEDETDANGDIRRISRPKRRLTLTTQLMQQVFRSSSPAVLSLVASFNHESIMYSLTRLTVGDTCSLVSLSKSDSSVHFGTGDLVCSIKTSGTQVDQHFSKVVEKFVDRAKELENELSRLDKRASILEYRLEHLDMERFAVINRFALSHGRGQVDGSRSTSTSSDPTAIPQRACPQRYVSAQPMPSNIPDRVQCISL